MGDFVSTVRAGLDELFAGYGLPPGQGGESPDGSGQVIYCLPGARFHALFPGQSADVFGVDGGCVDLVVDGAHGDGAVGTRDGGWHVACARFDGSPLSVRGVPALSLQDEVAQLRSLLARLLAGEASIPWVEGRQPPPG